MNLNAAKEKISEKRGKKYHFIYRGSRNQLEEFDGVIVCCYPSIFKIELLDGSIKTFSYNDFIMKNIKILTC